MVKFQKRLDKLASRSAIVEVLYLVGQQLTEALPKAAFERKLENTVTPAANAVVKSTVMEILGDIEKNEEAVISDIPLDVREQYTNWLDKALQKEIDETGLSVSDSEVMRELETLRLVS